MSSFASAASITPGSPGPVCILGLGLIGGSLLRRLDAAHPGRPGLVFGWNRSPTVVDAAAAAGHDVSTDLEEVLTRARDTEALIVLGVPMPAIAGLLQRIAELYPGAALTDVVSVKGPVLAAVRAAGLGTRYVGGHPMAGTNRTGWAATDPELFCGATWVVGTDGATASKTAEPDVATWQRVAALATRAGSRIVALDAAEHDGAVARISHLPHVFAEALAISGAAGGEATLALGAGSFRDGTRVAGTPPDLVRAICEPNAEALLGVLDEAIAELLAARESLAEHGSLGDLIDRGAQGRNAFARAHGLNTHSRDQVPADAPTADTQAEPVPVEIGAPGWVEQARAAGRAGRAVVPITTRLD